MRMLQRFDSGMRTPHISACEILANTAVITNNGTRPIMLLVSSTCYAHMVQELATITDGVQVAYDVLMVGTLEPVPVRENTNRLDPLIFARAVRLHSPTWGSRAIDVTTFCGALAIGADGTVMCAHHFSACSGKHANDTTNAFKVFIDSATNAYPYVSSLQTVLCDACDKRRIPLHVGMTPLFERRLFWDLAAHNYFEASHIETVRSITRDHIFGLPYSVISVQHPFFAGRYNGMSECEFAVTVCGMFVESRKELPNGYTIGRCGSVVSVEHAQCHEYQGLCKN